MGTLASADKISFGGQISKRDFLRVQSLLMPIWARWYVFVPCVIYLFVSFGVGWSQAISDPHSSAQDFMFAALALLISAAISRYSRTKSWRSTTALVGSVRGVASESGIEWSTSNTTSTFDWKKFIKVNQTKDLSLVFYAPRCAFYFPREFFLLRMNGKNLMQCFVLTSPFDFAIDVVATLKCNGIKERR